MLIRKAVLFSFFLSLVLPWGTACSDGENDIVPPEDTGTQTVDVAVTPDVQADMAEPVPEEHHVPVGIEDLTFYVGPHLMHTTQNSVAIVWETVEPGNTRVEYGLDESYGSHITGPEGTMHELVVTGLEPATVYHYRACTGDHCTADLSFSTTPLPGQNFRFVAYGDSRSDAPSHRAVINTIIDSEPVLVLNVGDIVASGAREEYKVEHFDPTRQLGHHVPIYVSIGNHEWKESDELSTLDVPNFREYMAFPEHEGQRLTELSYSFTYGDAYFISLDNTIDGGDIFFPIGTAEPPLAQWLREHVESEEAQNAKWRFAFMHYPPGSPCHEDWANIIQTREHVLPLLQDHGFHAVFTGHVHDYERQDWNGMPVIITGGGGAGLQEDAFCTGATPELIERVSTYHHVTVDLGDDTAHFRAVDLDGEVFDEITIQN